jgi:hypothetical protein
MLLDSLKKITDPRSYHGREYRHYDILYFTVLAILSNAKTYADVATFIRVNFDDLKNHFNLKWRQAPDQSAIRKIIVRLDPKEVETIFRSDAQALEKKGDQDSFRHICVDGKLLRGSFSHTKNKRAQGVFSAFAAHSQLVLARLPLDSKKDHEIPAMQQFLLDLDLKGVVVTADAIHCQKKLSSAPTKPKRFS